MKAKTTKEIYRIYPNGQTAFYTVPRPDGGCDSDGRNYIIYAVIERTKNTIQVIEASSWKTKKYTCQVQAENDYEYFHVEGVKVKASDVYETTKIR